MKAKLKLMIYFGLGLFLISCGFVFFSNFINASSTDITQIFSDNSDVKKINDQIAQNKDKIDNLKQAAEEYEQKIEEFRNQSTTLKNQLGLMDNQILKLEIDIKTKQLEIDKTKLEIESLQLQIDDEQNEIDNKKGDLVEYIKLIDKSDNKSYLEILILNESFAEFFNQINYLEEIQNTIQNTVDRLKLLKEAIGLQKSEKELQRSELDKLKDQLIAREEKLSSDKQAKEILFTETQSSEYAFQDLLTQTKQQQSSISAEILNLKDQLEEKIKRLRGGSTDPKTTLQGWPVPSRIITSNFHDPDYLYRNIFEHPAIDIKAGQGTPIKAPAPGYVARVRDNGYGYNYITLIHDNGLSTVYGHVSAFNVSEDTYVNTGDIIAYSGGRPGTLGAGPLTTGPHLHFEVRLNGIPVNPLEYLP